MNKKNRILKLTITLIIFCSGIYAEKIYDYFNFKKQYDSREKVVITQLKEIKRLEVLQANLFSYKTYDSGSYLKLNKNKFIVLAKGKGIYGIDFTNNFSVKINDKKIKLNLPNVRLLDLIVIPESIDFLNVTKGMLTTQTDFETIKKSMLLELKNKLGKEARKKEVLNQAEENTINLITSVLKGLGFEDIEIDFKKNNVKL